MKSTIHKTLAFAVIAILFGSALVTANADTGYALTEDDPVQDQERPQRTTQTVETHTLLRERIAQAMNETREELRETTDEQAREQLREELRERILNETELVRLELRERLEAERASAYRQARERYVQAAEEYVQARREIAEKEPRSVGLEMRKRVAYAALEQIEGYLEMLENRVEESDGYTAEQRERVLERVQEYQVWLESAHARIDAAQTPEQLSDVIGRMRSEWASVQSFARQTANENLLLHLNQVIRQSETASERVENRMRAIERAGGDPESIGELNERFDAHVEQAREHFATARRAYASEDTSPEAHDASRAAIAAAREELSQARDVMRSIVAEMRSLEVVA